MLIFPAVLLLVQEEFDLGYAGLGILASAAFVCYGLAALPAYIEQMETAESVDDGGPAVQTTYRLMVPWHPSITTRTMLEWVDNGTTRILNIRACTDRDQRRRTLEIEAVEVTL